MIDKYFIPFSRQSVQIAGELSQCWEVFEFYTIPLSVIADEQLFLLKVLSERTCRTLPTLSLVVSEFKVLNWGHWFDLIFVRGELCSGFICFTRLWSLQAIISAVDGMTPFSKVRRRWSYFCVLFSVYSIQVVCPCQCRCALFFL